jgi:hydrogenase-4 component B
VIQVTAEAAVLWAFGSLLVGAVLTTASMRSRRLCAWLACLSVGVALLMGIRAALGIAEAGGPLEFHVLSLGFLRSSLSVRLDWLSAMLSLCVLLLGLLCAVYAAGYLQSLRTANMLGFWPSYLCFLAGMYGVLCVSDFLFFIVMWEFMSLPAYALIVYEKERRENLRAGLKYLVMTHVANVGMFVGVLVLYKHCGSFGFGDMQAGLASLAASRPWLTNLVLALISLAFITKAGLFPVGDWIPDAQSAAPSPVSALLSGMTEKLGAYGIIRVFFWLAPVSVLPESWLLWWGIVLGGWGALSALVGSAAAVMSNDSKRLLAYSSIAQSGYIFVAIGIAVAFARSQPLISVVALVAAMLHILADASHKSLLFLTAGSVLCRTGLRDLDRLGGLMGKMPSTGTAAIVGILSLAGMPLTGAFVSKWLMFQSGLFGGLHSAIFIVYVVVGLFASVMAIAYGVKYFGATFLGPCSAEVEQSEAREVPYGMDLAQMVLAGICVLLGVLAVVPLAWCQASLPPFLATASKAAFPEAGFWALAPFLGGQGASGMFAPLWVGGLFAACLLLCWWLSRSGGAPLRQVAGWVCGEEVSPQLTRARAHGYFWAPGAYLANIYPQIGLPRIALPDKMPPVLDVDQWAWVRITRACRRAAAWLGALHSGVPQLYMLWQALGAALLILILWLAVQVGH